MPRPLISRRGWRWYFFFHHHPEVTGTIGIADPDRVDLSNLHRQILYRSSAVGEYKVACAKRALEESISLRRDLLIAFRLNPLVQVNTFENGLTPSNAVSIVSHFGVVLDCTDAPSTRYLISDVCVALSKPLISGSALGTEGQIAVYGYQGGPCYRCIFPNPPPPETVLTCGEGGILGPGVNFNVVSELTISCRGDGANAGARGNQGDDGFKDVLESLPALHELILGI